MIENRLAQAGACSCLNCLIRSSVLYRAHIQDGQAPAFVSLDSMDIFLLVSQHLHLHLRCIDFFGISKCARCEKNLFRPEIAMLYACAPFVG